MYVNGKESPLLQLYTIPSTTEAFNFIESNKKWKMTVKKSIDKLYSVFSLYEPPAKIKHFNCNHCVSDKDEDFLLNTPLKELDDNIFGLYFEACNVGKFPSSNHKYFIPRLLELLALEEPNKNCNYSGSYAD